MEDIFSLPPLPEFAYFSLIFRRLAEAFDISDDSDPFNVRSSGSKFSDSLKDDARYVTWGVFCDCCFYYFYLF